MRCITATIIIFMAIWSEVSGQTDTSADKAYTYAEEDLYEDDPYFWSYSREIGVNFTPLISKLVPFNLGQNNAGNIGLIYKKYYSKRAFRISLGAQITEFDTQDVPDFFYLALGLETRHPITKDKKISYTSSWDAFFQANENSFGPEFGIAKGYGFEYHISKRLFLSTQAFFKIGFGSGSEAPILDFQLPTAVFVNVRLY